MAQWDQQFLEYLKRAGEDLKRTGEELRKEAVRVVDEVKDPETQAKIRGKLTELGGWAKKTAEDAAGMIETAVKKAEGAVREVVKTEPSSAGTSSSSATSKDRAERTSAPPAPSAATSKGKPASPKRAAKTVGKKAAGGSRKPGMGSSKPKKSIGRKK